MQLEIPRRRAFTSDWRVPRLRVDQRTAARVATATVALVAFAVYLTTLAPTVMWYDMGEFAVASATLGIAHNTGYPLLILLGKAFTFLPVGDTAYRVNLMSAVFTALAVAVVFGIIRDLTEDTIAAAAGALTLAFSSTVWANATWATSYGLNLFFTALVVRQMLAWRRDRRPATLVLAALAFGLGLCNHRLIALVAPPSLLLIASGWRSLDRRTIALGALAFLAGLSVYLYLPIRGEQEPALSWAQPANWHTYWSMFLNGQTPSASWRFDVADRIDVLWTYSAYDLTWAGLALAGVGFVLCALRDRVLAACFALFLLLDAALVLTYSIHNVYNYLTPAYVVLAVLIGLAAARLIDEARRLAERSDVRPALAVALAVTLLALLPASLVAKNHARVDRSGDYRAYDFARTTLERLPARAVVLTDSWSAPPFWYVQLVEGGRHDVLISPIFSVPGEDVVAFARTRMDEGRTVYVAEGLRTPLDDLDEAFVVQPVLLDSIEIMLTNVLPKPEYRDALVAKGTLYKLLDAEPVATAVAVPAGAERDAAFAVGVTLAGFETDGNVIDRGGVVRLTYYWRADGPIDADLSAVTLFLDAEGRTESTAGVPAWSQDRDLGQGRPHDERVAVRRDRVRVVRHARPAHDAARRLRCDSRRLRRCRRPPRARRREGQLRHGGPDHDPVGAFRADALKRLQDFATGLLKKGYRGRAPCRGPGASPRSTPIPLGGRMEGQLFVLRVFSTMPASAEVAAAAVA
ncbi:MAG: DUF2723 domain-containing protein [Dehalococcoidia bacterium]